MLIAQVAFRSFSSRAGTDTTCTDGQRESQTPPITLPTHASTTAGVGNEKSRQLLMVTVVLR